MIIWIILIILSLLFIIKFDFISQKINLYDFPDKKRKFQKIKVSLLGGPLIAVFFNLYIFLNINHLTDFESFPNLLLLESYREVGLFFIISNSLFLIGLYDDKYDLSPKDKIFLIILFISIFVYFDQDVKIYELRSSILNKTFFLQGSSFIFTVTCFFVLIVALNMFDGINGQSFLNFIAIFLFLISYQIFQKISFFIIFSLIIFSYLNFKNKIYLGDSGVYFCGFLTSYFIIKTYNYNYLIYVEEVIIILIIPIIDMLRLFIIRIFNGKNPFLPDRNHIHHIIQNKFGNKAIYIIFILLFIPLLLLILKFNHLYIILIQVSLYFLSTILILKNNEI